MDKAARKKLNLKAIRKYDTAIVNILDQSPHAVLYYFSNEKREWVKKLVEGVLFLVQRNAPPYFAVYIMNRLAMENYTLYLTDFDDMELHEDFIIYSTSNGDQYAFWLYEEGDRQRLLSKITTLHDGIQKELSAKTTTTTKTPRTEPHQKSMPLPPPAPHQQPSPEKSEMDLLTFLKRGLAQGTTSTRHHHPPNEYGPEYSEQQQTLMNQSPAILHSSTPPPPPPPPPPQTDCPATMEFSLPDSKLMQSSQSYRDSSLGHPLFQMLKNGTISSSSSSSSSINNNNNDKYSQQQQQYNVPSPDIQRQRQQQPTDPGLRLLELLKKTTIDDKVGQHMPSPPLPPVSLGYGGKPRQSHYDPKPQIMTHPSSSFSTPTQQQAATTTTTPHILFGKELTKAYQPNMPAPPPVLMDHRSRNHNNNGNNHQVSPRNSASLLQALQGGNSGGGGNVMTSPHHQHLGGGFPTDSSTTALHGSPGGPTLSSRFSSISNVTPLMTHQSLDLTQTELNKRFVGKQHKFLSKPEFIQQFLNIVQNDPTFFDILYEDYKAQKSSVVSIENS